LGKEELWLAASNISSLVIDRVCDEAEGEDIAIARSNCDFSEKREQTIPNSMGTIPNQLVTGGGVQEGVQRHLDGQLLEEMGIS